LRLTADERRRIDLCVSACEARTGAQVVAAVVDKSDHYPEIPWKAFALGVALATLALTALEVVRPAWPSDYRFVASSVAVLATGGLLALLTLRIPGFARLFLDGARAEAEARHHAQILFLRHELFATRGRNGLLIFASQLERRIVVLPDAALAARIPESDFGRIVAHVGALLAVGRVADALCAGIAEAEALLETHGFTAAARRDNPLPDAVIEEADAGRDARR
jgi:putative membrane protein